MAFKYEIKVGTDEKYYGNNVTFATKAEANGAGASKYMNWTMAEAYRVVESDEVPNYRWDETDGLVPLTFTNSGVSSLHTSTGV